MSAAVVKQVRMLIQRSHSTTSQLAFFPNHEYFIDDTGFVCVWNGGGGGGGHMFNTLNLRVFHLKAHHGNTMVSGCVTMVIPCHF